MHDIGLYDHAKTPIHIYSFVMKHNFLLDMTRELCTLRYWRLQGDYSSLIDDYFRLMCILNSKPETFSLIYIYFLSASRILLSSMYSRRHP